ncbi:MAG: hypothetical protein JWM12_3 [Ilumatobacteraceae bacterium]|nr:hypothetical protein [Ilumatobacteraceae bacterium]
MSHSRTQSTFSVSQIGCGSPIATAAVTNDNARALCELDVRC